MISEWQVLDWLNRYSSSQLSPTNAQDIELIRSSSLPEEEKRDLLDNLMSLAGTLANTLEEAEVEANCGVFCYARGMMFEAERSLLRAYLLYEQCQEEHRKIMVEWLLYVYFNSHTDRMQALDWLRQARTGLWNRSRYYAKRKDEHENERKERWYRERVFDITSDQFVTPRYVFETIIEFQGTRLSTAARIIREQIEELLKDRKQEEVNEKLKSLRKITQHALNPAESAEALAYSGLVTGEMDSTKDKDAIRLLRSALALYIPESYEYTIVCWMLGLILYSVPEKQYQAVATMEKCISNAVQLIQRADRQDQQTLHLWYELMGEAMRRVMRRMAATTA